MLKNNDVPSMMSRVSVALAKGTRAQPPRTVVFVTDATRDEVGISALRQRSKIQIEFHSGSNRPVVGPLVRFGKRVFRRLIRWYMAPIMNQQSRFNNEVLDVNDKMLAEHEKLVTQVALLREQVFHLRSLLEDDVLMSNPEAPIERGSAEVAS